VASKGFQKGVFFVAISQFGVAFSFQCMLTFLPFYIRRVSPYGPQETMLWIGVILGGSHIVTSIASSFWGGLTSRYSPKLLFERAMICNALTILFMGFTQNLQLLLVLRVIQGALGGVSTIGLILVSALSSEERLSKEISLYQNAITAGQLVGPPVGAFLASLLGYRAPFIVAFGFMAIFIVFCHLFVQDVPLQPKQPPSESSVKKSILFGWMLCLMMTVHLTFLPSILPNILTGFLLSEADALKSAGFVIMSYTAAAILGNYGLSRLAGRAGMKKIITLACLVAALFQILLVLSQSVISFTLLRMVQMGFVAAVIPLIFSIFARNVGGRTIGFLNSARFFGMAVGPLMATSVLAVSNLLTLYLIIAALTMGSWWAFMGSMRTLPTELERGSCPS
jgi:DHA1 family multidrug resistance protein-like MFS transporter